MSDTALHPTLREILSQPGNPDAVPVELQAPDAARAEFEADIAAVDGPAPAIAEVRALTLQGAAGPLEARLYRPETAAPGGPAMLYFHGGGYIRGSLDTHDSGVRTLANASGWVVVSCRYRLAPEHPYPAAADDALAAFADLVARAGDLGIDPARIVLAGDSAGGNLAAVTALRSRDAGGPAAAAQLLIYPVIDQAAETESRRLYSSGYLLNSMPFYTACYLPDPARRREPNASPLHAESLAGLPPAVVLTAGYDPLRDEALAYADRLRDAGVRVRALHYPDMIHGFCLLRGLLPEADVALAAAARATVELLQG